MPTSQIKLRTHPANPHVHSKNQIGQIARSIRQFGFTVPIIVDETNVILAGHGRRLAAKDLGLNRVRTALINMGKQQKCRRKY
jgi:ParB-like chromosome segregation protein Spo0J